MHVPHTQTYITKRCLINAPSQGCIDLLYVPCCTEAKLHRTAVYTVDIKATGSAKGHMLLDYATLIAAPSTQPPLLSPKRCPSHLHEDPGVLYLLLWPVVQICHDCYALLENNLRDTQQIN